MNILGIIPARGGSKSIPHKNIVDLGGKPLIAWTIDAATASKKINQTIISTDDQKIAATAKQYGGHVPFMRPDDLASDVAPALPVIQHAITEMEKSGKKIDAVIYLQPTSPFRTAAQIDEALSLFGNPEIDTIVSVVQIPHNMTPSSLMREHNGKLEFMASEQERKFRRQDKETLYARNGPAILAIRRTVIMDQKKLYGDYIQKYEMDFSTSWDIDTPEDLIIARKLMP